MTKNNNSSKDFFKPEMIRLIGRLVEDLERNVPYVDDVKFLDNVEYVEGVEGGIEISDLIEKIPETDEEIKLIKKRVIAEPLYIDNLISKDGRTAAIAMTFELYPEEQKKKADVRHQVGQKVLEILARPEYGNMELYTAGGPIYDCEYDKLSGKESSTFGLLCLALNLLIPKLSGFLLDLRRSLAHKGFAKILDISTGMPAVFANPFGEEKGRYQ